MLLIVGLGFMYWMDYASNVLQVVLYVLIRPN